MLYFDPDMINPNAVEVFDVLNIEKTAQATPLDPCAFSVTLSVEGTTQEVVTPLYIVLVVDATSSMGTVDMNNNTASRFQVAVEAIQGYLDIIFGPSFEEFEKHIALVTFGNGARVHVTAADGTGPFSALVNPAPMPTSPTGAPVTDYYIGASEWSTTQPVTALNNYNSVTDKTLFFYQTEAEVLEMVNNISRYSNTNAQSGILLAHSLLNGVPEGSNKMMIFVTDGESAASSTFYAYYNEANIPSRINSATLVQQNGQLFARYNTILAPVTDEDLVREGINPNNYDPADFTPLQTVGLKLRALARSEAFFLEATSGLIINPFAGEWHNFDTINAGGITRVPLVPNLLVDSTLNGYYWSNGHIGFAANYYYYEQSPYFAKVDGIWQYSQTPPNPVSLEPVYNDLFWPQSIIGQQLETVVFDNSQTELMIFATDQKLEETRMIDYYEQTSRNIYASNQAKRFMIQAAQEARLDGIVINAIGIGSNILLPEYLDEVASSGVAFIVPRDINDSQDVLRDQMVGFTEAVLFAVNNLLLTDNIRRRDPSLPCADDDSFTVDPASIQIAFVHQPGDPIVFQPVDLDTSENVALVLENTRSIIAFFVGTLWSAEDAAEEPDRFFRALITFTIHPNPGVRSNNTAGNPDIPTNILARVDWTDAGEDVFQVFPNPRVYVDASCAVCPPVTRCQAVIDLVESVALQETALAHILNAEGEKMQAIINMEGATAEQMLAFNRSATRLLGSIARLEAMQQAKLRNISCLFEDCD